MRFVLVPLACPPPIASAEAVQRPRGVSHGDRFDVRHLSRRESPSDIGQLAEGICNASGRDAVLERAALYAPLDIRSATYGVPLSPAPRQATPGPTGE